MLQQQTWCARLHMVLQGLQILGLHILASLRTRVRLVCECACLVLKTRQDLFCRFAKLVVASVQHMGLHTWKLLAAFFANKIRFLQYFKVCVHKYGTCICMFCVMQQLGLQNLQH